MLENISLSFIGILSHKVRSLLTMLGIIIGIASIIAIVSTIKGTNEQIKNNLIGSGNNTVDISLYQGEWALDLSYQPIPAGVPVIDEETKSKLREIKEAEAVTVYRQRLTSDNVYYLNKSLSGGTILGIDEDYFDIFDYRMTQGKGFSKKDYTDNRKVAIIDNVTLKGLFDGGNAVGKILDINGEVFEIIGVAEIGTKFEPVIENIKDYYTYRSDESGKIFIPSQSWPIPFLFDEPQNCTLKAVDTDSMTNAGKKAADILNSRLKTGSDSAESIKYKSESLLEQAKSMQDLSASTNTMLIWIAGISLLVGGIGVMNIMLVSVTERTREIGLKKALGAKKSRILAQFLTEASVLTSIGGIIGVISGIGLSQIISKFAEVPVSISGFSVIVSVIFSMLVGILFGLLPSLKASKLDPIEALRYE